MPVQELVEGLPVPQKRSSASAGGRGPTGARSCWPSCWPNTRGAGGRASRFYKYNQETQIPENRGPNPETIFIALQPMGRREAKRLLLAQLES